jgi:hypothetical protein
MRLLVLLSVPGAGYQPCQYYCIFSPVLVNKTGTKTAFQPVKRRFGGMKCQQRGKKAPAIRAYCRGNDF